MNRARELERTKSAYTAVKGVAGTLGAADYLARARDLPTALLICGLAQTLASLVHTSSKSGAAGSQLLSDHLTGWIRERYFPDLDLTASPQDVINCVRGAESSVVRLAREEAMRYATWLKRFAEAFIAQVDPSTADAGAGRQSDAQSK